MEKNDISSSQVKMNGTNLVTNDSRTRISNKVSRNRIVLVKY